MAKRNKVDNKRVTLSPSIISFDEDKNFSTTKVIVKVSFKERYRKRVIELSARGQSYEEIITNLVHKDGVFLLEVYEEIKNNEKDLKGLVSEYEKLAYGWWVAQGRMFVIGTTLPSDEKLNYQVWYANMKNRYGWKDSSSVEVNSIVTFTEGEKEERVARLKRMSILSSSSMGESSSSIGEG